MDFKTQYIRAINDRKYDELVNILFKNLISNLDYKSICDFATCLCDSGDTGIHINLNKNECEAFGKKLLLYSYYNHPDISNALALQIVFLERTQNFDVVEDMLETAIILKNSSVLNNIAYAKYKRGKISDAFELQKRVVELNILDNELKFIFYYNLMLYDLFLNNGVTQKYDYKNILNMLISDEIFDYESAIVLAIFLDCNDFVKNNLMRFEKTFNFGSNIKNIINQYFVNKTSPNIIQLSKILQPKTYYEKCIYLLQ